MQVALTMAASVAEAQDRELRDDTRRAFVRSRLLAPPRTLATPRFLSTSSWRLVSLTAAAACAVLIWLRVETTPVRFSVGQESGIGATNTPISATQDDLSLHFTDGSNVELSPGSMLRIRELTPEGAYVQLDQGTATIEVHHRKGTRWFVEAGPYVVQVVGTRFSVSWDPDAEDFDLRVAEGAVRVQGPEALDEKVSGGHGLRLAAPSEASGDVAPAPAAVPTTDEEAEADESSPAPAPAVVPAQGNGPRGRRNQTPRRGPRAPRGSADASDDDFPSWFPREGEDLGDAAKDTIGDGGIKSPGTESEVSSGPADPAPNSLDEPGAVPDSKPEVEPPPKEPEEADEKKSEAPGWQDLVRKGDAEAALAELDEDAFDAVLQTGTAGDLRLLGMATRYSQDPRSVTVYETIRNRFPGSDSAASAAFVLGRLAFQRGDGGLASVWFETYLRERPMGRLAEQAAGRLIESHLENQDPKRARSAASSYLRRYPDGAFSALARSLVR